jgi:hypothetical protein
MLIDDEVNESELTIIPYIYCKQKQLCFFNHRHMVVLDRLNKDAVLVPVGETGDELAISERKRKLGCWHCWVDFEKRHDVDNLLTRADI